MVWTGLQHFGDPARWKFTLADKQVPQKHKSVAFRWI